jgi:outer membrane protein
MLALVHARTIISCFYFTCCASGYAQPASAQVRSVTAPAPVPPPTAAAPAAPSGVPLTFLRAVTTALQRQPALVAARSAFELARADQLTASAPFDTTLTAALGHDRRVAPSFTDTAELSARTDVTSLSLGASKSLAWGTNLQADVGLARDHARPAPGLAPLTQTANVGLTVTQPLLRGAGSVGASSQLRAAEYNARAAEDTLRHIAQQQAFNVIIAYWELVSAEQQLALLEASQARAQRLLDETKVLVDRDQRPRGDLRPLEAGLATRKRDVLTFESARLRALHALQLAMGLDLAESEDWHASDGFPAPGLPPASLDVLTRRALDVRFDLRAARASAQAATAAQSGAEHNTLPKLDLALSVGYGGGLARDGVGPFFDALARRKRAGSKRSCTSTHAWASACIRACR